MVKVVTNQWSNPTSSYTYSVPELIMHATLKRDDVEYLFLSKAGHITCSLSNKFWFPQIKPICLKSGMSNVRPAGRMRPANGFNAARETFSEYAYIKKKFF